MLKRKDINRILVLMVVLSFALLSGCAKPPTEEITKAETAVAEAKQKEADLYVQDVFAKAEESLKKAKDLVATKKYKEAKEIAEETARIAQQSVSMVEANKAKMKEEAEQMVKDIQGAMAELKTSVAMAIKKKAQINREEIQGMIGKWEIDMVNIKDQIQTGNIRQAYDSLPSIKEQVKSQAEGIAAALEPKIADKK
ncbi:MAG: DUF4398 domain-containing protein [Deltaproteobacteria bacterium]|nr:MAG: DUF4398 domain-containing protein [Deltaproteobacteria bacterium]